MDKLPANLVVVGHPLVLHKLTLMHAHAASRPTNTSCC